MALRCVVVTPERTELDREADYISLPMFDGELGVLKGRAPLIGAQLLHQFSDASRLLGKLHGIRGVPHGNVSRLVQRRRALRRVTFSLT